MNIIPQNNINFQKRHTASANVLYGRKTEPVEIYRLDEKEDIEYLNALTKNRKWKDSTYLIDIQQNFLHLFSYKDSRFYIMENKNKEILCIAQTKNDDKNLNLIEVVPMASKTNNEKRKTKYVGETMLAFFVKLAKKTKKNFFQVDQMDDNPKPFYIEHCNMHECSGKARLYATEYDSFIQQNKKHTEKEIEIY